MNKIIKDIAIVIGITAMNYLLVTWAVMWLDANAMPRALFFVSLLPGFLLALVAFAPRREYD